MSKQTYQFETKWSDSRGHKHNIGLRLKSINQRLELISITVSTSEELGFINQSVIREIPIKNLLKNALESQTKSSFDIVIRDINIELRSHHGRKTSDNQLRTLAALYEQTANSHQPILPTLSKLLGLPKSTINKRLILARRRGLLESKRERPDVKASGLRPTQKRETHVKQTPRDQRPKSRIRPSRRNDQHTSRIQD